MPTNITIPDPDDPHGMPIFDGPATDVRERLTPGTYQAVTEDGHEFSVTIREHRHTTKRDIAKDRRALDAIATLLGTAERWNGADMLEDIGDIVGTTVRPHPGDAVDTYCEQFEAATGREVPARWVVS